MRLVAMGIVSLGLLGCSVGPPLRVPHFRADDARVNTAGFVRETTRITRKVGDTKYTLMIFAVGDELTLGAMIQGEFRGTAYWSVGERQFAVLLDRRNRGRKDIPVAGAVDPATRFGQHGGFGDHDWVNVAVPLREWLTDGTSVRLEFHADGVDPITLPTSGGVFAARLTPVAINVDG